MILFDVGGTLFDDSRFNAINGLSRLRLASENPDVTDDDTLALEWNRYMNEISGLISSSKIQLDMPLNAAIKYITMKTGLHFNIPMIEQEEIFDRYNSSRKVLDNVPELLDALHSLSVRTAVISNNAMSGDALSLALKRWIPNEKFEFCLTSADILFTKPSEDIFASALGYAKLYPEECWYCGDSKIPDVKGSSSFGMSPVLIDTESHTPIELCKDEYCDGYIKVNNWCNLKDYLLSLKS